MTAPSPGAGPRMPERLTVVRGCEFVDEHGKDRGDAIGPFPGEECEALAAEIARRWNAYPALQAREAALRAALEGLVGMGDGDEGEIRALEWDGSVAWIDGQGYELADCIAAARAALSAAREGWAK